MKKILLLIVIVVLGFFASNYIIQSNIQKTISKLDDIGVEVKITDKEGFLTQKRYFDLKIHNGKKFRNFLFDSYSNIVKEHKKLFDSLSKKIDDLKSDNIIEKPYFKGTIKNSIINPFKDIDINIFLDRFSDDIMSEIKDDSFLQNILKKKLINFDLIVEKNGHLKNLKLKDIDEKTKIGHESLHTKIVSFNINDRSKDKLYQGDLGVKNIKFLVSENNQENIVFDANNLKNDIKFTNLYNYSNKTNIDDFLISITTLINIKAKKNYINTEVSSDDQKLNSNINFDLDNIVFSQKGVDNLSIDGLKSNFKISGLDLKTYRELDALNIEDMINLLDSTYTSLEQIQANQIRTTELVKKLLEFGFAVNLDIKIKDLKTLNESLKNLDFTINADSDKSNLKQVNAFKLTGNSKLKIDSIDILNNNLKNLNLVADFSIEPITLTDNAESFLNATNLNATATLLKDDFNKLINSLPPEVSSQAQELVVLKGDKAVFEFKIQNGQVNVNGKQIF